MEARHPIRGGEERERPFGNQERKGGRGYKGVGGGREGFDEYCNQAFFSFSKNSTEFQGLLNVKAEGESIDHFIHLMGSSPSRAKKAFFAD